VKVLLLAPNGGVSLSTGGGSNFLLKQAKALARVGHEVTLAGFHALSRDELERQHGVSLDGVRDRIQVLSGGGGLEFHAHRSLPGKPSPYFALFDPRVSRWIDRLGERARPDLVWFHDDIPRAARWARWVHARLYVHYPLTGRTAAIAPPLRRTRGVGEIAQDAFLRRTAARIVEPSPREIVEGIYANSRVTQTVCQHLWSAPATVLPTYVPVGERPAGPRNERIVSVATFHRGKGLETVVNSFLALRRTGADLTMIGHPRDPAYLARLRRSAASGPAGQLIRFRPSAGRDELRATLRSAAAVVGAAEFEPFGLAVLEGMSEGASPLVRRSEYSGAWTDLMEAGLRGSGFDSAEELTALMERSLENASSGPDEAALRRAAEYSEERFQIAMAEATA
jgi:glycosyltransferase involved in cell wall biosynthesis